MTRLPAGKAGIRLMRTVLINENHKHQCHLRSVHQYLEMPYNENKKRKIK